MENIESFYPLSPMQQGMLFHAVHTEQSGVYLRRVGFVLEGELDTQAFRDAWENQLRRHAVLRTGFVWEGTKEPIQVVYRDVSLPWTELDWSDLSPAQQQIELSRLSQADQDKGFDLTQAPLIRCAIIRIAPQRYQFCLTLHHILVDGWSMPLLLKDVFANYEVLRRHERLDSHPPKPYRDFIIWLRHRNQNGAETFWRNYLAGFTAPTPLPNDRKNSTEQSALYDKQEVTFSAGQTAKLRHSARHSRVTMNTLVQGAWSLLLARYSGEDDVVFGTTVSGRPSELAGSEAMVGLFINTLPVRVRVTSTDVVTSWLQNLQLQQAELRSHQYTSLLDVQRWSDIPPGESLFKSIVVFENYPIGSFLESSSGLSLAESVESLEWNTFPLTLQVFDNDELNIAILYDAMRFDRDMIGRMLGHFQNLLAEMLSDPERRVSALPLPSEPERRQLLGWNETARRYPEVPIHRLIEQQLERAPDSVAVVFNDQQLTCDELNQRANQTAHFLRAHGVGPDVLVGVCMERSLELIIGLLGILKAGGAYVPIDPDYPRDRIEFMLRDAQPQVLLTQAHLAGTLPETASQIVCLDRDWPAIGLHGVENCASAINLENLAYVIYTSGSTGRPKGAMNTHRGLSNRLLWMQETYGLNEDDRVLQKTPFSFDVSVWEFFWPLLSGARLIIARPGGHQDPAYLADVIRLQGITTIHFVPSMLQIFLEEPDLRACKSLKRVICSGEALAPELQARFFSSLECELHNLYGPTEASIDVTFWRCERTDAGSTVPIGRPIANTQIYVLDRDLNPVPIGVPGELHIGGIGLARGYWRRPELTNEKFIADPFSAVPGARLYKSGDRARFRPDGNIEYLGRLDSQIKIRGQRIELGEIEATLAGHAGIKDSAVVLREDSPGEKRLVAYLVGKTEAKIPASELRSFLKQRLPEAMIPAAFVWLDRMPLSPNGKLDRRALPVLGQSRSDVDNPYVAPRTPLEEQIARIWSEALKVERIGIHDNFFELGGDSIVAMQTVSRMKTVGMKVTTRNLFKNPTVAQLARIDSPAEECQDIAPEPSGSVPLTPIQQWFFEQELANPDHWNQPILLRPRSRLEADWVRRALSAVGQRHDSLRLRFQNREGEWHQGYELSADIIPLDTIDLSDLPPHEQNAAIEAHAASLQSSLRLGRGPLARAALYELGASQRLLLIAHHLVIDAVSWRILLDHLQIAYRQISVGSETELPPRTASFQNWAEHLLTLAKSSDIEKKIGYWASQDWNTAASLPFDFAGSNSEMSSHTLWQTLPSGPTTSLLRHANQAYRTQVTDLLLTALVRALSAWTGANVHALNLESHGREDLFDGIDLSGTTGWFTSLYPVLLRHSPSLSPGEALKSLKEQLRAVPAGGVVYGVARYLQRENSSKLSSVPSPRVMFNYLGQFDDKLSEPSLFAFAEEGIGPAHGGENSRSHLLEVNCWVVNGELRIGWTYSRELHRTEGIAQLADSFLLNLQELIAHCAAPGTRGFTPSDFPLARLNQTQVDQIAATNPDLQDVYALSPMQQGMLFHTLYEPAGDLYFEQLSCRFSGNLDVGAFEKAWNLVITRHPALRTAFLWNNVEEPLQVVHRRVPVNVHVEHWESLTPEEQDSRLAAYLEADRGRGFDLTVPPLMRWALFQTAPHSYSFVWSWSHLLLDGWSLPIIWSEVFATYKGLLEGQQVTPRRALPYRDYIAWLQEQKEADAEIFWRSELKGFSSPTPLVFAAAPAAPKAERKYAMERLLLPETLTAAIGRFARENHLTLNTVLQGAWALLLSHYSGERDVVFGATFSGRPDVLPEVDSTVGLFINTLPIRVQTRRDEPLVNWLSRLQEHQLELRQFESTPLVQIQGWSEVPSGSALFESLVVFENYPLENSAIATDLGVEELRLFERSNYPLNLVIAPGRELLLAIVYECGRFDLRALERLLEHLKNLLSCMLTSATQPLSALSPLNEVERHQLLTEWNSTGTDYPRIPIHRLVEQHAAAGPHNIAAVFEGRQLTYAELNERANQLARYLIRSAVQPGDLVGLCVDRSLDAIVGMLAILKAGGAYVPLDPEYPAERLKFMLEDIKAPLVVTQERWIGALSQLGVKAVCIDRDWTAISAEDASNPVVSVTSDDLAYVIYTSGSTGSPKGVSVPHRAVVRLVKETNYASFSPEEVFLHAAPASFDAATFEIWGALANGARIVVAPKDVVLRTSEFARLLREQKITTLFLTTALFNQLVRENPAIFAGVKQVLFGGEQVEPHWVGQVLQHGAPARLVHVYGPTETTTFATWHKVDSVDKGDTTVPIGRPISNTTLYVLNMQGEIVPAGVPGELYIGGEGLACEYLNRPELTAQRFVSNPFTAAPGDRLYKTGDLVKYREGGALEFLGRFDNQVKIRGFRIEPGEIEAVLACHDGVKKNVVLAREDLPGEKRLVAYIVPRATLWPDVAEFRQYLKDRLPDYMVPAAFVLMDDLPLSPNGKVDRRALAPPEQNAHLTTQFVAPESDLERTLAAIWQQTLGVEKVGRDNNFFDLGGHSLLAARITSRVIDAFGVEIPISAIFENPTVAQLSSVIELQLQAGIKRDTPVISARSREAFRAKQSQFTTVNSQD